MQKFIILFIGFILLFNISSFAQDLKTSIAGNKELDSLRKKEESKRDSVVFSAKYIRYTTYNLTKDSIQTLAIDTNLAGIQHFSPIAQPRNPTVGTGLIGLAATPLLFQSNTKIGFQPGFHALDYYLLQHDDVKFYRARTPFTSLQYVSASDNVQMLKMTHSQNIKPNWNFGANFNRIGANGFYAHQRGDILNADIFTWYHTKNKRYNLWVDGVFNTMKAQENGSLLRDTTIFTIVGGELINKKAEPVRLNTARQLYRENSWRIKQSYFVGRIDTTSVSANQNVLPTNKITYTFEYTKSAYSFKKEEADTYHVLPPTTFGDAVFTNDTTGVKHLRNEFIYSFFLRAKGSSVIKNELKLDAGIRHDYYNFNQMVMLPNNNIPLVARHFSVQNSTLLGNAGYRFSDKVNFNLSLQQIFQGRNIGDFLYEVNSYFAMGKKLGKIVLTASMLNKSPEEIYRAYEGNHYRWNNASTFDNTKTANLNFNYLNDVLKLDASASYYLITDYLYFASSPTVANAIAPMQHGGNISLLQFKVGKQFDLKSFHLNAYTVYQKTDYQQLIRNPNWYVFASLYKDQTFFKSLKTQLGFDIYYNDSYISKSYSPASGQFYNGSNISFGSKPVVDAWLKAGLLRANLFLKYQYANQGIFSNGYYTVNRYPMPDKLLLFGVTWNFYD